MCILIIRFMHTLPLLENRGYMNRIVNCMKKTISVTCTLNGNFVAEVDENLRLTRVWRQ